MSDIGSLTVLLLLPLLRLRGRGGKGRAGRGERVLEEETREKDEEEEDEEEEDEEEEDGAVEKASEGAKGEWRGRISRAAEASEQT